MLWSKSLETGIPLIDQQHKELFDQIDVLLNVSNKDRIAETLNFLDKYVLKHFADEQKIHAEAKYPKAADHKKLHENYIVSFRKLKDQCIKDGFGLSTVTSVNKNVVEWLKDHIMVHDKEFSTYYKALKK